MKTIRVRLANTVILCAATGLVVAVSLAGSAQSDDRGNWKAPRSLFPSAGAKVDTKQDAQMTQELRALFAKKQTGEIETADAQSEGQTIQLAANEVLAPEPNPQIERKSDILKHLEELYQKDGREMPPMSLDQAPGTSGAASAPSPPPQHHLQQQPQQQHPVQQQTTMQPPAVTAARQELQAPAESETKRPGLLRRLFKKPARSAKAETQTPAKTNKPQIRTSKAPANNVRVQNQTPGTPQAQQQQLQQPQVQPQLQQQPQPTQNANVVNTAPQVQQTTTTVDESVRTNVVAPADATTQDVQFHKATASPADRAGVEEPGNDTAYQTPVVAQPANVTAALPAQPAAPQPVQPVPAQPVQAQPQQIAPETEESAPEENPFTGLKLTEEESGKAQIVPEEPAELKADTHTAKEVTPWIGSTTDAPADDHVRAAQPATLPQGAEPTALPEESTVESKLQKILERSGKPGLKGLCVVALRDERELVDAQPEFQAEHEGKSYFFSSAKAKAKFLVNPRKYVPVAAGSDVVVLAHNHQAVAGTLDHSLWFRERLYLFSSEETRDTFMNNPRQYVDVAVDAAAR